VIESSPAEKDLGVLMVENLGMSHKCVLIAQKASCISGCIIRTMASRLREVILSLYSGENPPGVLHSALGPSAQERRGRVGTGPEKGNKDDQRAGTPLL